VSPGACQASCADHRCGKACTTCFRPR
jgi:hypothetical protein